MNKFELCFVGYDEFENEEEAKEFGFKMEEALGFLTKDNLNLYLANVEDMMKLGVVSLTYDGVNVKLNLNGSIIFDYDCVNEEEASNLKENLEGLIQYLKW